MSIYLKLIILFLLYIIFFENQSRGIFLNYFSLENYYYAIPLIMQTRAQDYTVRCAQFCNWSRIHTRALSPARYRSFGIHWRNNVDGIGNCNGHTSVKVATLTVHLRLKPGGSHESLEREGVENGQTHKGQLASSEAAVCSSCEWIRLWNFHCQRASYTAVRFVPE